jgi:hypothetical protein
MRTHGKAFAEMREAMDRSQVMVRKRQAALGRARPTPDPSAHELGST